MVGTGLLLAAALLVAACGQGAPTTQAGVSQAPSGPTSQQKPQAVTQPPSSSESSSEDSKAQPATLSLEGVTSRQSAGLIGGTFQVDGPCLVYHRPDAPPTLLIWPEGLVEFSERSGDLTFTDPVDDSIVEITAGQQVDFGGTPLHSRGGFETAPHPSCPEDAFLVTSIDTSLRARDDTQG